MKKSLIAIASPAGGVGKSTLSKELAALYAKTKLDGIPLRTCIVDANITFGSQRILFGIGQTKYDIENLILDYRENVKNYGFNNIDTIYDWDGLQKYFTYVKHLNVYLLPAPERPSSVNVSLSEADVIFRLLMKYFDVVIVDTANDASSFTISAILLSSYTAFVLVDDERSIAKTIQMRRVLNSLGCGDRLKHDCGIIYNMYQPKKSRYLEVMDVEERVKLPVIETIPYYQELWTYNNRQVIIAEHNTPVSESIKDLAAFLLPEAGLERAKRGFLSSLFQKIGIK